MMLRSSFRGLYSHGVAGRVGMVGSVGVLVAVAAIEASAGVLDRAGGQEQSVARVNAAPAEPAPCPRGEPGTVLWRARVADGLLRDLAVSDQGMIVGSKNVGYNAMIAQDCRGALLWRHEPLAMAAPFEGMHILNALPVIDRRGHVHANSFWHSGISQNGGGEFSSVVWEMDAQGRFRSTTPPLWTDHVGFGGNVVLDAEDRVAAVAAIFGDDPPKPSMVETALFTFDRFGWATDYLPLVGHALHGEPIGLADGRIVLAAEVDRFVVHPTVMPTPPPTAVSPRPSLVDIFLPIARTDAWPPRPPTDPSRPPSRVDLPARLIVVAADRKSAVVMPADISAIGIFDGGNSSINGEAVLVATGDVVIAATEFQEPRLAAFHVGGASARKLWEHFPGQAIVESPVLGRLDPSTGRLEIVYTRSDGVMVSLEAPGTETAVGPLTLNWAVDLDALDLSPPVLGDAGVAYVAHGARVSAFSRDDGRALWTTPIADALSTLGGIAMDPAGTLYVTTLRTDAHVSAIATESDGLDPDARWPTVRHDSRRTGRAAR